MQVKVLYSVVSAAEQEIANYPFTTLVPNWGMVNYRDYRSFVMADIPGIIEGASEGKGLGYRFLRHIERNALLLFMVPADTDDYQREYEILLNELVVYNPELADKNRILAITKSDMLDEEMQAEIELQLPQDIPYVYFIGDWPKYNGIEGQDLVCSKRRIVIALVDSIMEWDKQLFLMLHQLFSASTDTFWLAVTKTFTWLPVYCARCTLN